MNPDEWQCFWVNHTPYLLRIYCTRKNSTTNSHEVKSDRAYLLGLARNPASADCTTYPSMHLVCRRNILGPSSPFKDKWHVERTYGVKYDSNIHIYRIYKVKLSLFVYPFITATMLKGVLYCIPMYPQVHPQSLRMDCTGRFLQLSIVHFNCCEPRLLEVAVSESYNVPNVNIMKSVPGGVSTASSIALLTFKRVFLPFTTNRHSEPFLWNIPAVSLTS